MKRITRVLTLVFILTFVFIATLAFEWFQAWLPSLAVGAVMSGLYTWLGHVMYYEENEPKTKGEPMSEWEKTTKLRGAIAGAMKYHPVYEGTVYWQTILKGDKVDLSCMTIFGDVFAFWYSELRLAPELYDTVWNFFSSVPR